MKCQILLSGKNKKNITNLSSAEFVRCTASIYTLSLVEDSFRKDLPFVCRDDKMMYQTYEKKKSLDQMR